jgi:phosphatidylserine decarboxylase
MISDAFRFLLPLLGLAAGAVWLGSVVAAVFFGVLCAFVAFFFRNPNRDIPAGDNLVVSPADGKVVKVVEVPAANGGDTPGHAVSIFLNIFNVHVNRSPISGVLEDLEYRRGLFKAAYDHEASRVNEQNILTIRGQGMQVTVKQIAGLIARRVVCWKKPGHALERGELFGLIRFGSRVDVLLPATVRVVVREGDHVKAGSSVIGVLA